MIASFSTETPIAFSEAADHIPGRPHLATLHRWRQRGVRGVRLESFLVGHKRFTTVEAIARFVAALNAGAGDTVSPPRSNRANRVAKARAQLATLGR